MEYLIVDEIIEIDRIVTNGTHLISEINKLLIYRQINYISRDKCLSLTIPIIDIFVTVYLSFYTYKNMKIYNCLINKKIFNDI